MEKTIRFALFMFIVSGLIFSGCEYEDDDYEDDDDYVEVEVTLGDKSEFGVEGLTVEVVGEPVVKEEAVAEETVVEEAPAEEEPAPAEESVSLYKNGTYTQSVTYNTPAGPESIDLTITVEGDIVTGASIVDHSTDRESQEYVERFVKGLDALSNGVALAELDSVSVVNGSSLTTGGFNEALAAIKVSAAN